LAAPTSVTPSASVSREGDTVVVRLAGPLRLRDGLPSTAEVTRALEATPPPRLVRVDASAVGPWDTALVAVVARIYDACNARSIVLDTADVPRDARQILGMARQDALLSGTRLDEPEDARLGEQFAEWARGWAKVTAGAARIHGASPAVRPEALVDVIGHWTIQWGRSLGG